VSPGNPVAAPYGARIPEAGSGAGGAMVARVVALVVMQPPAAAANSSWRQEVSPGQAIDFRCWPAAVCAPERPGASHLTAEPPDPPTEPEPRPDPFPAPLLPAPNAAPWWCRWLGVG
jgi:hypothetical protein